MEPVTIEAVPWKHPLTGPLPDLEDISHQTRTTVNAMWGSRLSMIVPLKNDITLGMFHCSHVNFNIPAHCGGVTRVAIPLGCFILFNCQVYHYGDKCKLAGCQPLQSVRAFGYLVEQNYVPPHILETYKAGFFCDADGCSECLRMRTILKEVVDEENIWSPDEESVQKANIGEPVFGDVYTLGWAVVKGCNPSVDFKEWEISRELSKMVWHDGDSWQAIGSSYTGLSSKMKTRAKKDNDDLVIDGVRIMPKNLETRELKQKSLQTDHYNLLALREVAGTVSVREMKYVKGGDDVLSKLCPIISSMLSCNLLLANLFLHKFTEVGVVYKYFGLNFLRNRNFVMEQYIHHDFEDSRCDPKK